MRRRNGRSGWSGRRKAAGAPGGGGGPLIRRWIGARRRRESGESPGARGEGAEIVVLTWAQTFGRDSAAATPDPREAPTRRSVETIVGPVEGPPGQVEPGEGGRNR